MRSSSSVSSVSVNTEWGSSSSVSSVLHWVRSSLSVSSVLHWVRSHLSVLLAVFNFEWGQVPVLAQWVLHWIMRSSWVLAQCNTEWGQVWQCGHNHMEIIWRFGLGQLGNMSFYWSHGAIRLTNLSQGQIKLKRGKLCRHVMCFDNDSIPGWLCTMQLPQANLTQTPK
jgi:hypothetical protein